MENDNPFAYIAELSRISSSQEEHLRHCRFAGEQEEDDTLPDDELGDIPVASTGIVMVSPPESPEQIGTDDNLSRDNDIFHTPPEGSTLVASQEQQQPVAVENYSDRTVEGVVNDEELATIDANFTDGSKAVDLGRDTDLGFSDKVELTETIAVDSDQVSSPGVNQAHDNQVTHRNSINFSNTERVLARSDGICESPVKSSNTVNMNFDSAESTIDRIIKSTEKLKSWSKKSKVLDEKLVLESFTDTLGTETETETEILGKAVETLISGEITPKNCLKTVENHQCVEEVGVGGDLESHEESSAKRKLNFYNGPLEHHPQENTAVLESIGNGTEGGSKEIKDREDDRPFKINNRCLIANSPEKQNGNKQKSIDDIEKFRYVGPTVANFSKKDSIVIPQQLQGSTSSAGTTGVLLNKRPCSKKNADDILLKVLSIFAKDYKYDLNLNNLSVLEVAKRRCMTFP